MSVVRRIWRSRRLKKTAIVFLLFLLFGPVLLILPLRVIDPPTTALMLARTLERYRKGKTPAYPKRIVVPLEKVHPDLVRAILASEDDGFYLHHGFDVRQIQRAISDQRGGKRLRGASTISQQTAKNLFLWSGRSVVRKGLEAYLTFYLELLLPKDRILEIYLSLVECADGVFGVEMASRHYFKKAAAEVSSEEAARLASVLPNPRKWSPFGDYAGERASQILELIAKPTPRD
jgi:monofunctional biosynthetic peptidoglycan transglycosylase